MRKLINCLICACLLLTVVMQTGCNKEDPPKETGLLENSYTEKFVYPRAYFPRNIKMLDTQTIFPDLFRFMGMSADPNGDGLVETAEEWDARRAELRDIMMYYLFGYKQPTPRSSVSLRLSDTTYYVDIADNGTSASIKLDAFRVPVEGVDTNLKGPYPVVISIGALPEEQIVTLLSCGYAYISMNPESVYAENRAGGAYLKLYPYNEYNAKYDSGMLMGRAWGVSRIIDALQNELEKDKTFNVLWKENAVTGSGINANAAVLAGAYDERVDVTAPSDAGGGVLSGSRYTSGGQMFLYNSPSDGQIYSLNETIQRAVDEADYWFTSKIKDFMYEYMNNLPFDTNAVVAVCAPRAFIAWTGESQQAWINSPGTVMSVYAAMDAYDFIGAANNLAVIVRDGEVANQDRDLPDLIAIMDKTFGRSDTITRKYYSTLANSDGSAIDGNGVIYPEKSYSTVFELTRNPYAMLNSYLVWSKPGEYQIYSEDTYLVAGIEQMITINSNADAVMLLTLPSGKTSMSLVVEGRAIFLLQEKEAQIGEYVASTVGGDKEKNSIYLYGISLKDSLRHGLSLTSGNTDEATIGFSSSFDNYYSKTQPVELYVNGFRIDAATYDDGTKAGYIARYGLSLNLQGAPYENWDGQEFVFSAKNIQIGALNDYCLSIETTLSQTTITDANGTRNVFASIFDEEANWASDNLQNTPSYGLYKGAWPMYPNKLEDTEARPAVKSTASNGFAVTAQIVSYNKTGIMISFSEPVNPHEFGVALNCAQRWNAAWNEEHTLVQLEFDEPSDIGDFTCILFRLVDAQNRMIEEPIILTFSL